MTAETLKPVLKKHVDEQTTLMTDEAAVYKKIAPEFAGHESVNHSRDEYVNKIRPWLHSNTVESSFALLKRGPHGTFHSVSEQHLQRYATEFDLRWTYRIKTGSDDTQRATMILSNIAGKCLTCRA